MCVDTPRIRPAAVSGRGEDGGSLHAPARYKVSALRLLLLTPLWRQQAGLGCVPCVLSAAARCSVGEVSQDVKCFMDLFDQMSTLVQARDQHSLPRIGSEYRNCVFGECAPLRGGVA